MLPLNPKGARLRVRCVVVFDKCLHILVLWPVHKALVNLTIQAQHNALFSVTMGHANCWSLVYKDALWQQPGHVLLMIVYICKLKTEEQALIQCFSYRDCRSKGLVVECWQWSSVAVQTENSQLHLQGLKKQLLFYGEEE